MERTVDVMLRSERFVTDQVLGFQERQRCNRPAELITRVLLAEPVPIDELVGTRAHLSCNTTGDVPRDFYGIIESAEIEANPQEHGVSVRPTYRLRIVSQLALLARSHDCRIFQDQNVRDIVSRVLADHGFPGNAVDWRLRGSYPTREYCVQYRETALHFISRLVESEGIYFFTEADPEAELERLVFADKSSAAEACTDDALPVRANAQLQGEGAAIYSLDETRAVRSGHVTLRSYDFRRPDLDLTCSVDAGHTKDLEVYEFTDEYVAPKEGKRLAELRLEALQSETHRVHVTSDSPAIHAGRLLTIDDGGTRKTYFVVAHEHAYDNDRRRRTDASQDQHTYWVRADLLPVELPFRPPRVHAPPRIQGPQTATVVAPRDSELETIHTDEHGRCKVRFHWDHSGEFFDQASCWMRVGQLQTSGSMVLPRVHWEVLVEFIQGNPDWPVVTGRLYNGTFMPPYALPEGRTRTSLQSASTPAGGGRNEVRFEDRAGAEEIMIHSQYDTAIAAANNREQVVNKDSTIVVGNNASLEVGADQTIQVTNGFETTVGGNQQVNVGANRKIGVNAVYGLTVAGDASTTIGGNLFEIDGNPLQALLTLAASRAVELASAEAARVAAEVQGAVQGAVNQALGPINDLQRSVNALGAGMAALNNGNLAASAGLIAGTSSLPDMGALSRSMGAGPAATRSGPEDDKSAGGISARAAIDAAVTGGLRRAVGAALGKATGKDGAGARGRSAANVAGPVADLSGFAEEDLSQGPGYTELGVQGNHSEEVGAMRVTAAAAAVMINAQSASESVGAAHIELIKGSRAESVEGASSETQPAQIVVVGGDQSESVKGALQSMVGGAVVRQVGGDRTVSSSGAVSLAAAAHQIEAKSKITLKCGGSSIVIDGSGIVIQAPVVNISAGKVDLPKNVNDG